jgi:outer membrane protein assembly factor BamB
VALAFGFFAAASPGAADDWPQWRGVHRDGLSAESGLRYSWQGGSPPVVWSRPLGEGFSGISVVGGRAYTMVGRGDDELVVCLDAITGDDVWERRVDRKFTEGHGHGPRSTPTVHDGTVYALSAWGALVAIGAGTGDLIWARDLRGEYGGREQASEPWRGYATSPLVVDGLLVVEVGGTDGRGVMAFDRLTGVPLWSALSDPPAYSSPITITADDREQIVFLNGAAVVALTLRGEQVWRYEWATSYDQNVATPLRIAPGRVFVSEGYDDKGGVMLAADAAGAREAWRSEVMRNDFGTCVYLDGFIYGFDGTSLKCIDATDGAEQWIKRGYGRGTLIAADGRLFVLGERGQLAIIEARPDVYTLLTDVKQAIAGKCWTAPSLADGGLYLRDEKTLLRMDLTGGLPRR